MEHFAQIFYKKKFQNFFAVPTVQLIGFGFAFWVAMTRVTDHMHHPSDVIAGAFLGTIIQVSEIYYISR